MIDWDALRLEETGLVPVDRWNQLVTMVKMVAITSVMGGTFERSEAGTTLDLRPNGGAGGTSEVLHPLMVTSAATATEAKANIRWGRIMGIALPGATVPDGLTVDLPIDDGVIYVETTFDAEDDFVSMTVEVDDPMPASTILVWRLALADFSVTWNAGVPSVTIGQIVSGSQDHLLCGENHVSWHI